MTSPRDTSRLVDKTEDWFVRNGIPHFIDDFSASEDVWTRAVGFLSFVFFAEMFLTFGDNVSGWAQVGVFVAGLGVIVAAIMFVNRLRGRRPFARPEDIGIGELALFVLVPPVLALLGGHDDSGGFLGVVALNIIVLIVVYLIVSLGLFAMVRWGIDVMWQHLGQVLQLLGRTLPLMLLFSAFLFLNAEIWQVANELTWPLFTIVLSALALIGIVFVFGAMPEAINILRWFDDWAEVEAELDETPLEGLAVADFPDAPKRVPLHAAAKRNLTIRLGVGLVAQVALVTLLIFGFYLGFGILTVREQTMLQWTTLTSLADVEIAATTLGSDRLVLTRLHVVVASVVATFSGLQFAVSLVTDSTYREEFMAESNAEVREALAVRAVYLRLRAGLTA
ncbi:MAG: hypothetical protein ACR2P0_15955 [Acidimicrobiales bacterium]